MRTNRWAWSLVLWGAPAHAQPVERPGAGHAECGTVVSGAEMEAAAAYRAGGDPGPLVRDVLYVPLNFYIVRRSDGSGGAATWRIGRAMDDANSAWAQAGVQFCQRFPTRWIDDDGFYDIGTRAEADLLRDSYGLPDSINVYVVNTLVLEGNAVCALSSFTWSPAQGIVIDADCLGAFSNSTTFPHEIGHYFDLLHTHETARGRECVDGSNCLTAGDQICDTPADPGLSSQNVDGNCAYIGSETDPCHGDPYAPDPRNLLSSAPVNCRDRLTPGQAGVAAATLLGLRPGLARAACDLCAPDLNSDGQVNTLDVLAFLNLYTAGNPSADWNADGLVDSRDVLAFLNDWAAGCGP